MLKRYISFLIAACLGLGSLTVFGNDFAYNSDAITVSADGQIIENDADTMKRPTTTPQATDNQNQNQEENSLNLRSFDGTNADGTLYPKERINTNLIENSSKYNGMASNPVSEAPALSRYSTERITLAPDITGTQYEEAAELLGALGIMVGDAEDGAFRPNDDIIRSEMAKVAVYSVGLEDIVKTSATATRFPDVPANHWATGAINVADQYKLVYGDTEGTFRPDAPVLLQEAITIMVRAMGYQPAAEDRGGYPAGYLAIASSNQLLRGISGSVTEPASRGDVAQLIFNSLTVNLMEQVQYGTNVSYEVVDKTLLYDRLNVEKGYGQVTATKETSLNGDEETDAGTVMIDNKEFLEGDSAATQLLGYNVLYYARLDKTTDDKTIITIRPQENKNKVINANSDDIVAVTGEGAEKSFEYWASPEDRSTKTVTIPEKATYIYNGKYKTGVTNQDLKPTSGNVILLDADRNGNYEIVFVNHITNLVVDTVSEITGRVTDKYLNGSLVFDDEDESVIYSLVKDGKEIKVTDLEEWNVISYTISDDRELIKGYVSDAVINGTVTESTDEGFRIGNGKELYKKAASYPNEIRIRDRGNFYLDIENKIAAVDTNATVDNETASSRKYAYLLGAAMNSGFDTTAQFKLFTMTGETSVLNSSSKMRFNKNYGQEPSTVVEGLKNNLNQIIVYETNNDGDVTAIELAKDNTSTGAPNVGEFTKNLAKTDVVYKSASGKLGSVGIDNSTVIFDIPETAGTDTDKFAIRNKASLSNDSEYDIIVYDLQENYVAKVVVITSSTGAAAPESPILVVDFVGQTQNQDYEDTDRLYGWQNGKEIDIIAADKSVLVKGDNKSLKKGDIIQYRTNAEGEIDSINLLFDIDAKETEFTRNVTEDLTTVYGKVTRKFGGSINMSVNGNVVNYATGDATVYLYDSTRNKADIQVVSPADIEIFEEGNEARLFVKIYDDVVEEMVIVK